MAQAVGASLAEIGRVRKVLLEYIRRVREIEELLRKDLEERKLGLGRKIVQGK